MKNFWAGSYASVDGYRQQNFESLTDSSTQPFKTSSTQEWRHRILGKRASTTFQTPAGTAGRHLHDL